MVLSKPRGRSREKPKIRPDDGKLAELILLICDKSQDDPAFGALKLNKLLFHCDFSAYLTYGTPITGQEYFALPKGPAPKRLIPVTKKMQAKGELGYKQIEYYGHFQKRPIALRPANVDVFTAKQINLIDEIIRKYKGLNATEISERSHLFLGWKVAAERRETIPYSTALVSRRKATPEERERGLELENAALNVLRRHSHG